MARELRLWVSADLLRDVDVRPIVNPLAVFISSRAEREGVLRSEADLSRNIVDRGMEIHHDGAVDGPRLHSVQPGRDLRVVLTDVIALPVEDCTVLALDKRHHEDIVEAEILQQVRARVDAELLLDVLQGLRVCLLDLFLLLLGL